MISLHISTLFIVIKTTLRLVTSAARLSDDTVHVLDLRLGTAESTELLLGELTGTLVLGVAEQFNDAALIGSETSNLLDKVTDEGSALAKVTLGAANAGLGDAGGGLVALVETGGNARAGSLLGSGHCAG